MEVKERVECFGKIWYEGLLDEVMNLHHCGFSLLESSRASRLDKMVSKLFNSLSKKRAGDAPTTQRAEKTPRTEGTSA